MNDRNRPSSDPASAEAALPEAPSDIRSVVREKYGAIAEGRASEPGCCGSACGCAADQGSGVLEQIGYTAAESAHVPEESDLGLGCGNPLALADVRPGESVLDLGSGAGVDCFLASRAVGPSGRVIGVDMTPAMIERARATAARRGYGNVEFRLGEIERLPVDPGTIDLVISNCVINLSPDKPRAFAEAYRVLRPGGRLVVSDLVLVRPLPAALRRSVELYVGCVAGASQRDEYLRLLQEAGFDPVEVARESGYRVGIDALAPGSPERAAFEAVVSITVRAHKP